MILRFILKGKWDEVLKRNERGRDNIQSLLRQSQVMCLKVGFHDL